MVSFLSLIRLLSSCINTCNKSSFPLLQLRQAISERDKTTVYRARKGSRQNIVSTVKLIKLKKLQIFCKRMLVFSHQKISVSTLLSFTSGNITFLLDLKTKYLQTG